MIKVRQLATLAAAVVVAVAVVGCNTIEGAGKDLKAAGEGVEKAAAKSKPY
jgi:predicted small secreted protein